MAQRMDPLSVVVVDMSVRRQQYRENPLGQLMSLMEPIRVLLLSREMYCFQILE